jgi:pimeloyl-ACP methyl ester carboxylesterase
MSEAWDVSPPLTPPIPEGRHLVLPGRGTTFIREEPGPAGAPTLVLLHGWMATAGLNWMACFEPLSRWFRVVALDHRGHGRGIRSRRPFRLEDCADDVAALAEALELTSIIPVGYSMGGPIAQLTWRRHPELVEGLVLCATARRFSSQGPAERAMASGVFGLSLAASLTPPGLRRLAVGRILTNRLADTPLGEWAASELRRNNPAALLQAGAALTRYDARPWLGGVDVPTAVVVTTLDRVVAPESQLALAHSIPNAQVFEARGDHGVCAMRPDRFVPPMLAACQHVARQAEARQAEARRAAKPR